MPAIATADGIIPVRELTTEEILYGDRVTSYRWDVLTHNPTTGTDSLAGYLDGVEEPSGSLSWSLYKAVKGSGSLKVKDLRHARAGLLRIGDVPLASARIRPVLQIAGLPPIPLGVFLFTSAPEDWGSSGRVYSLELLDRNTVLDQDIAEVSYVVPAGTGILQAIATVIASAGEAITVDTSNPATLASAMVWPAGTSKLQIVNDLLSALNYNSLWVDGPGKYRATPYVLPARRSINYELLTGLRRELVDGPTSIYAEDWSRDRDLFKVPNRVITVQSASGDEEPLTGLAENTTTDPADPTYPFSYGARGGRWISKLVDGVEVPDGTPLEQQDYLNAKARQSLIASSSVQATVEVKTLPIPVRVSDVLRFANAPAGIDARHVVTSIDLEAHPAGLMTSSLQEVVDL